MSATVVSSSASSASSAALLRMNPVAAQRAKREVEKRRGDIKTYTVPVIFAGEFDRKAFLQSHYKKFTNPKKTSMYRLQLTKKYPTTVGKFHHDLVEHSGVVTSEEFWLRYDYRCGDMVRVLRELQAIRQESKKQLVKDKKKKKGSDGTTVKEASPVKECKKEVTGSATMSWLNFRSLPSSKPSRGSTTTAQGGIEAAATVDTTDEEHRDGTAVNHVENFKRSLGGADLAEASPAETAQTLQGDPLEGSDVTSIFRGNPKGETAQGTLHRLKFPALVLGVWCLAVLLASIAESPSSWMSQGFGNRICSPIRPGTVLEAQALVKKDESDASLTFSAPWWVPSPMKGAVFSYLCATDAQGNRRRQTELTYKVQSKKFIQVRDVPYLAVTVSQIGGDEEGKDLIQVRKSKAFSADSDCTKLSAEKFNGGVKEFEAPWALP